MLLADVLKKFRRPEFLIISFLGVVFFNTFFIVVGPGAEKGMWASMPAFQLAFTKDNAMAILAAWGEEGVARTAGFLWVDFIYPIFYAAFLSGSLSYFVLQGPFRFWLFLPPVAAILDMAENVLQYRIFAQYPEIHGGLVWAQSILAALKWGLVAIVLLLLVFFVLRWALLRGIRR